MRVLRRRLTQKGVMTRAAVWPSLTLLAATAALACRSESEKTPTPSPIPTPVAPVDAQVGRVAQLPNYDPAAGHLDIDPSTSPPPHTAAPRQQRVLELILRSSPPGANVMVDGQNVGVTPLYWEGAFDGRVRDFAFALPGHALARYRFVPTANGVVHARLARIQSDSQSKTAPESSPPTEQPRPTREPSRAPPTIDAPTRAVPDSPPDSSPQPPVPSTVPPSPSTAPSMGPPT